MKNNTMTEFIDHEEEAIEAAIVAGIEVGWFVDDGGFDGTLRDEMYAVLNKAMNKMLKANGWVWCEVYETPMQRHNATGVQSFTAFLKNPCPGPHQELIVGPDMVQ